MKTLTVSAVALLGLALSGCATVIEGSSEKIAVSTAPVSGARCVLSNGEGHWSVRTPGSVTVDRSKEDMKIRCDKDGYKSAGGTIPSEIEGWAFVDLPLIVTFATDFVTGAVNRYSEAVHVTLHPIGGEPPPEQQEQPQDQDSSY